MTAFKVAIIGAGIAGCTLARLLLNHENVQVVIFEADVSLDARSQGGTLDLHTATGLAAIKAANLYKDFVKYARFDGESIIICDKAGLRYVDMGGGTEDKNRGRPEIDRLQLRQLLLDSLPEGMVRWGYRLKSVHDDLSLEFDQGIEGGFSLVVGADGAFSKVRPLVSSVKPVYSGVGGGQFTVTNPRDNFPDLYKLINRGSVMAWSDGGSIIAQQLGDGNLVGWTFAAEDERHILGDDPAAYKVEQLKKYHDWAPELRQVVEAGDEDTFWHKPLYMLPVGHRWEHKAGITLIGDAAHLTPPFAGIGANIAMEDALKLSKIILKAADEKDAKLMDAGVKRFELDMFKRGKYAQQITVDNMRDVYFTENTPRSTIAPWMIRMASTQFGHLAATILSPLIYLYFWWFKLCH